jgi:hypothetical protein
MVVNARCSDGHQAMQLKLHVWLCWLQGALQLAYVQLQEGQQPLQGIVAVGCDAAALLYEAMPSPWLVLLLV